MLYGAPDSIGELSNVWEWDGKSWQKGAETVPPKSTCECSRAMTIALSVQRPISVMRTA
jgi:hypothetical protein